MFLLQCLQSLALAAIVLFPEGDKALQGDLKTANDAYVAGNFPEARRLLLDLAEKKDADAAYALGRIYQTGEGAPDDKADPAKAEEYYRKAADTGHEKARLNLAGLLMSDPKKILEGMKILKDTATAGSGKAMLVLGQLYAGGQVVEQNLTTARDFFEKAAAAGESDGYVLVGQMFEIGQGADPDITKAVELYEKAAAGKSIQGMMRLASLYANGANGVDKNLDKAKEWLTKATETETDGAAAVNLGVILENLDKKPADAYKWFQKAADQGNPTGMERLAALQASGAAGEKKDPKESFAWYEKAAKAGNVNAMFAVATAYEKGVGTEANPKEAKDWLFKSAFSGSGAAMREVAQHYRQGSYGLKDMLAAIAWFKRAIDSGDGEAAIAFASMLQKGEEMPRDMKSAISLLTRAADAGSADAQVQLADIYAQGIGTPVDLIRGYALLLAAGDFEPAKAKRDELATKMSKEQIAEAQKELDRLRGKTAAPAPAPTPPATPAQ